MGFLHTFPSVMESFINSWAPNATLKSWEVVGSRALRVTAGNSPARTVLLLWGIYFIARCIYNLCFHPLHKIPGPRIAAMTSLYDFWYDAVKGGTYLWEISKMHDIYGKMAILAAIAPSLGPSDCAPSNTMIRSNRPYQSERGAHQ